MFRLRAKTILITYSQLNDEQLAAFNDNPTSHCDFVTENFGPPLVYRAGRESHQDGGNHIHVFCSWGDRITSRDPRCLDFGGSHPNIKPIPRTPAKAWEYAGKENNIIHEYGSIDGGNRTPRTGRDGIFGDALAETTKEGFLSTVRNMAPRDYVLYYDQLERFADHHYRSEPAPYASPEFRVRNPARLDAAIRDMGIGRSDGRRPKSLILSGPTRTGKTVWARSLGKNIFSRRSPAVQPPQPA